MKIIGRIRKDGNSLVFLIPKEYVSLLSLRKNDVVEIDIHKKRVLK